ncbi:MAG: guanylate kinase [Oscillospiraceae bacterium]|jgi:guanylate kinase|nr:guanylate kinase [Oscillospiraceae bacterium]
MAGLLLVVSGPSGAGKSTVLKAVMEKRGDMFFSVSATTRPPRPGETDGCEYYFISPAEFAKMQEEGLLLETGEFAGNWYGTPRAPVMERLSRGETVVLDIESAGAAQVRERCPEAVTVFLTPSSEDEAERRLRSRGTEAEEVIQRRLLASRKEYMEIDQYQYIIINDSLEEAVLTLDAVILAEMARAERNPRLFSRYRNLRQIW